MEIEEQQSPSDYSSSNYSSEDDDARLLTDKVKEKLLTTVAKLKARDPSIYKTEKPIFNDEDFEEEEKEVERVEKKYTYKDMLREGNAEDSDEEDLPPALDEAKAKQSLKRALKAVDTKGELFTIKQAKIGNVEAQDDATKLTNLTKKFDRKGAKLLRKVWENKDQLDETDLFLKKYILDKKWLTSKYREDGQLKNGEEKIDEEDQQRSVEMDVYEAEYNFRFQEPGSDKIVQFPRTIQDSLRIKPQTRKEKRKKLQKRKKEDEMELRNEAKKKKTDLKEQILERMNEGVTGDEGYEHDWFFCDDCTRGFEEGEAHYMCNQCENYLLCEECFDLIIHKHQMTKAKIPKGFGAPREEVREEILCNLSSCKNCRRRLPKTMNRYEYLDKSYFTNVLCEKCYDQSNLQIKKKYKQIAPEQYNYEQLIEQDPQKIKELTNSKEVEDMVDEYLKTEFEGVLSGGMKTKFRYISVPPESFGLSDQQILFGDDRELNKYVSIKKLAPYRAGQLRLRNSIFNKKIKGIEKTVRYNKRVAERGEAKVLKMRFLQKMRLRAGAMKLRRTQRLRIRNLSDPVRERNYLVSSNRLASYGLTEEV